MHSNTSYGVVEDRGVVSTPDSQVISFYNRAYSKPDDWVHIVALFGGYIEHSRTGTGAMLKTYSV